MKLENSSESISASIDATKSQLIHIKGKSKSRPKEELHEYPLPLSNNIQKHKMPVIILNYIIKEAKEKQVDRRSNRFKEVAEKMIEMGNKNNANQMFNCEICEMDVLEKEKLSVGACTHHYCASCLHQYIIYKIQKFEKVECPKESCHTVLDENSLCFLQLPFDARRKYKKLINFTKSLENPSYKLCPNSECEGFLSIPFDQENDNGIKNPQCNICRKSYCSECYFEEHSGSCDPHHITFFQDTLHYRQCSRCKNVIEKESGCNHMTCRCGYQFCYICGANWHHSHLCKNPEGAELEEPELPCCGRFSVCRIIPKILFILLFVAMILPLTIIWTISAAILKVMMGLVMGLVSFHCLLEEAEIEYNWKHVVVGILLLPVTVVLLMGFGVYSMFTGDRLKQMEEVICLSCNFFRSVVLFNIIEEISGTKTSTCYGEQIGQRTYSIREQIENVNLEDEWAEKFFL